MRRGVAELIRRFYPEAEIWVARRYRTGESFLVQDLQSDIFEDYDPNAVDQLGTTNGILYELRRRAFNEMVRRILSGEEYTENSFNDMVSNIVESHVGIPVISMLGSSGRWTFPYSKATLDRVMNKGTRQAILTAGSRVRRASELRVMLPMHRLVSDFMSPLELSLNWFAGLLEYHDEDQEL